MKNKAAQKLIMLIPAFWAALFDMTITVIYQPNAYWKGDLNVANEANPIGAFAMKHHVFGFFIISFLWLLIIGAVGSFLPKKALVFFSMFVLLCHTWGGSSWIMNHFGFWFVMLFISINTYLFLYCQNLYYSKQLIKTN